MHLYKSIRLLKPVSILLIFCTVISCHVNTVPESGRLLPGSDSVIVKYEGKFDHLPLWPRINKDSATLAFWGKFNDTVEVYVNGKRQHQFFLTDKNNPVYESDYSGYDVKIYARNKKPVVSVRVLHSGRRISFILNKEFPLCNIMMKEKVWHVNYRVNYNEIITHRIYR